VEVVKQTVEIQRDIRNQVERLGNEVVRGLDNPPTEPERAARLVERILEFCKTIWDLARDWQTVGQVLASCAHVLRPFLRVAGLVT
jgi:hypothetical protein